jgi:hypothetical protein
VERNNKLKIYFSGHGPSVVSRTVMATPNVDRGISFFSWDISGQKKRVMRQPSGRILRSGT